MNPTLYTLGELRSCVYRALDEYSSNGMEHERFSGGTADTDKRFIAALNSAIRRVYLSCARTLSTLEVCFRPGEILTQRESLLLTSSETVELTVPEGTGAVSFDYSGSGSLTYKTAGETLQTVSLNSSFGQYGTYRGFLPAGADFVVMAAKGSFSLRRLRMYSEASLYGNTDAAFLPDGKRLFCVFSPLCAELHSVTRRGTAYPTDLFSFENGVLSCDEKYAGDYTVSFYAYPQPIAENAPYDTPISLPPAASDAVIYAAAAELCDREDGELYTRLLYKYRELLTNTYPAENLRRKNSFFAGGLFGRRRSLRTFRG